MNNARNLIAAIIYCALLDWHERKSDVRAFFTSKHGKDLCEILGLSAEYILRKLESGKIKLREEE